MEPLRIAFFGTPAFAVPALERLGTGQYTVAGVFTGPDKPVGRSRTLSPSPVKVRAAALGYEIFQPATLKDDDTFAAFSRLAPDLCVVVAYGKLIPARYLDAPRLGFVNVHPSLLPKWRGASPIRAALLNGDAETGVSLMLLDAEMDHGPVLAQHRISLDGTEYAPELSDRLSRIGAELLAEKLPLYAMDGIQPVEQDHAAATVCGKFSRQDARIDWNEPAVRVAAKVRAMAGEPVAWTTFKGKSLNILRAEAHRHQEPQTGPGRVLGFEGEILVDTPDGTVVLRELQAAGKNAMSARDFTNGHRDFLGSVLE
ncbi:MAG TPA: methionyl-tRNA formyltransferase [Candidatus Paceibacterota bacterium]|nr:methionyl-tRNA formyltransferase [Candidatus Paceibacterota bacterium]